MWTRVYEALAACLNLLLPAACLLCGRQLAGPDGEAAFCHGCQTSMLPLGPGHCRRCALPFVHAQAHHLCGACLRQPPVFTTVHTAGLYQGGIKDAVQRLKYRDQLILAAPLGRLLGTSLAAEASRFAAHCVVPVPLHPERLRQRGYNQALEIARPLARQLGVPLDVTLLQRIRRTPPQQGLTAAERRRNVRNAFALTATTLPANILLVDDVMTTGATVRECSQTLLAGGAREIQVAVVGRA